MQVSAHRLKQAPKAARQGRSPTRDAVKIRCRKRRTSSSAARQLMACQFRGRPPVRSPRRQRQASSLVASPWCPTCPSVPISLSVFPHRLTWPASAPFRVRALVPYPASYPQDRRRRGRPTRPEVSCCLSATGISFSGHPLPARGLGLPHGRLTGHRPHARTLTGLPRSTRMRNDRGGCLLYPEGDGTHPADKKSSTGACRSSAAQPLHPAPTTHQRGL